MHLRIAAIPGDRPFHRAVAAGLLGLAGKDLAGDGELLAHRRLEIVLQAAGEVEHGLVRDLGTFGQHARLAAPADLDAAEQIGLGARHTEDAGGVELHVKIGRVAVAGRWRGQGIAAAMIGRAIELHRAARDNRFYLTAQADKLPLYERFGFVAYGVEFLDGGMPSRIVSTLPAMTSEAAALASETSR